MFNRHPELGSTKVVRKFLWFSITLNDAKDVRTTRWLSTETINYIYEERAHFINEDGCYTKIKWWPASWVNERSLDDVFQYHPPHDPNAPHRMAP